MIHWKQLGDHKMKDLPRQFPIKWIMAWQQTHNRDFSFVLVETMSLWLSTVLVTSILTFKLVFKACFPGIRRCFNKVDQDILLDRDIDPQIPRCRSDKCEYFDYTLYLIFTHDSRKKSACSKFRNISSGQLGKSQWVSKSNSSILSSEIAFETA